MSVSACNRRSSGSTGGRRWRLGIRLDQRSAAGAHRDLPRPRGWKKNYARAIGEVYAVRRASIELDATGRRRLGRTTRWSRRPDGRGSALAFGVQRIIVNGWHFEGLADLGRLTN